jgi:hypothetical protein
MKNHGHSLAVSPLGYASLADGTQCGVTLVDFDTEDVSKARKRIPALTHDRPFSDPNPMNQQTDSLAVTLFGKSSADCARNTVAKALPWGWSCLTVLNHLARAQIEKHHPHWLTDVSLVPR